MRNKILALMLGFTATAVVIVPATPAHANLGLYRKNNVSVSDAVSPKSVTVSCNGNDQMLSVGGRVNDGQGNVLLTRAYSNAAGTLATASGIEAITTNVAWSVEVFIVCAPAGTVSNLTVEEVTTGPNVNSKSAVASCQRAGSKVYGGGFKLENAFGAAAIDEVFFDPSVNLDYVWVTAYNYVAAPSYSLTAQAFCGEPQGNRLVTWLSADNSISPKTETTPDCGADQVSGAGAQLTGALGTVGVATVIPKPLLTVAEVTGREIGNTGNLWEIEAQAICVG